MKKHLLFSLALVFVVSRVTAVHADDDTGARTTPNFILIFTDDQGYQDIGCFGSPNIDTPHLDRMAAEGRRFTDFYSAAPVCSASRAALLTGCYPLRVSIPGVLFPRNVIGLNPDEFTIADMLKAEGYATICIGKWHLGHHPEFLPMVHGFDSYFGIPYSNDMRISRDGVQGTPLMRNEEIIEHPADQATLTKRYTEEAVQFIRDNKDQPFFLYLPHTMPHIPLFASEQFLGTSERGLYGDVIEEIDWSVGQILATLKELDIDENTLVIYTSDNGPWLSKGAAGGSALPLRDGKFTTWEGGMREPCIMRWPGRITPDTVCSEMASTIDILPTFAALVGAELPADTIIDGIDVSVLLLEDEVADPPRDTFYYYKGNNLEAVRRENWKLRLAQGNKPAQLFDLSTDISERDNVAEQHADLVAELTAQAQEFAADLRANTRPPGRLSTE